MGGGTYSLGGGARAPVATPLYSDLENLEITKEGVRLIYPTVRYILYTRQYGILLIWIDEYNSNIITIEVNSS